MTGAPPGHSGPRRARGVGLAAGSLVGSWLLVLSGLLFVLPGSAMVWRNDVFFNADTAYSMQSYGRTWRGVSTMVHPLFHWIFRPLAHGGYRVLALLLAPEFAHVLAGRLLMAGLAGLATGVLFYALSRRGVDELRLVLLLPVYLGFTSSVAVCLPDYYGLSHAALALAFALSLLPLRPRTHLGSQALLAVLLGGITVTNVVFPLIVLAAARRRELLRGRRWAWAGGVAVAAGALALGGLVLFRGSAHWAPAVARAPVLGYVNLRLLESPELALVVAFRGLVDPVIGPTPTVDVHEGHPMVTYQAGQLRSSPWPYDPVQSVGALCWLALLLVTLRPGAWPAEDRTPRLVLLVWIAWNLVLHNIWGDELLLYSVHWSWALMALVLFGSRALDWRWLAGLALPLLIAQAYTIAQIRRVLGAIV